MVFRGHVQNGVVVLDEDICLPDGMEVRVEAVAACPETPDGDEESGMNRPGRDDA